MSLVSRQAAEAGPPVEGLLDRVRAIVQQVLQFRPKPFEPQSVPLRGIVEKARATTRFLKRKMAEYEELRREIENLKHELTGTSSGPK